VFVRDLVHESAFAGLRAAGAGDGVVAIERLGLAIATVMQRRGQSRQLSAAVTANFAVDLPVGAEWTANNGVAWLGTGPGKWLAIGEARETEFVGKLKTKLGEFASVVEQSDGLGVLRLTRSRVIQDAGKGRPGGPGAGCVSNRVGRRHQLCAYRRDLVEGGRSADG